MKLQVSAKIERWPVDGAFIISRGTKTYVDVIFCEIFDGVHRGIGEATPIYYEGETPEKCLLQINSFTQAYDVFDHQFLLHNMERGAARNALDCALWDLQSNRTDMPLWQLIEQTVPRPLSTAFTISLNEPLQMKADARAAADKFPILKLKLTGENDRARVAAVHQGAPRARLIVDANESWNNLNIAEETLALSKLGVELVEQPVTAGQDDRLAGVSAAIPLCADESCHTSADIDKIASHYDAVNIKLDKAGGLTEAIRLADAAQTAGLKIMVGCMLSTSLAIKPAFVLAQRARWVDLDGPILLAKDRAEHFRFSGGKIAPPETTAK